MNSKDKQYSSLWIELVKRGVTTLCVQKSSLLQYLISSMLPLWNYEDDGHLSRN